MAALNIAETQALHRAMEAIDAVLRGGFDKNEPLDSPRRKMLVDAKSSLLEIRKRKGWYSS